MCLKPNKIVRKISLSTHDQLLKHIWIYFRNAFKNRILRICFSKQRYFFVTKKQNFVIRLRPQNSRLFRDASARSPRDIRCAYICSVTSTRREETSRRQWGGRACIGREDNSVLGRDIFDVVETIAGLSGIIDHAPVFSEVHVALAEIETRGTLWRVPDESLRTREWLSTSRSQLTLLWRPTVLVSDAYFTGRPRGAQLAIASFKKKSREGRRVELEISIFRQPRGKKTIF